MLTEVVGSFWCVRDVSVTQKACRTSADEGLTFLLFSPSSFCIEKAWTFTLYFFSTKNMVLTFPSHKFLTYFCKFHLYIFPFLPLAFDFRLHLHINPLPTRKAEVWVQVKDPPFSSLLLPSPPPTGTWTWTWSLTFPPPSPSLPPSLPWPRVLGGLSGNLDG